MPGIQQRLPARPSSVPQARRAVADFMRLHSAQSAAVILDIALGVTEACANVVQHAYPDGGGQVGIEAALVDGDLVVSISDAGVGFDHLSSQPGAGLGVPLMERLAVTTIRSRPGCTRVQMRFELGTPAALAAD